jgi:hypothetical protein
LRNVRKVVGIAGPHRVEERAVRRRVDDAERIVRQGLRNLPVKFEYGFSSQLDTRGGSGFCL